MQCKVCYTSKNLLVCGTCDAFVCAKICCSTQFESTNYQVSALCKKCEESISRNLVSQHQVEMELVGLKTRMLLK
jgi:hypothetical protein